MGARTVANRVAMHEVELWPGLPPTPVQGRDQT